MKKRVRSIILICIGLVFLVVLINVILKIQNPFAAQDNNWIGFYGSIIGGFVTLIGVYISIEYDLFNQKEAKKSEWMPVLNCEESDLLLKSEKQSMTQSITNPIELIISDKSETGQQVKYIQRFLILKMKNHGQILFDLEIYNQDKVIYKKDMIVTQNI
jgi:hypothetical protein